MADKCEQKEEPNDDDLSTVGGTARPRATSTQPAAPKAVEDMTPEERARQDTVDIRCLDLCIGMLERCNSVSTPFDLLLIQILCVMLTGTTEQISRLSTKT